jgi:hypothetical protein
LKTSNKETGTEAFIRHPASDLGRVSTCPCGGGAMKGSASWSGFIGNYALDRNLARFITIKVAKLNFV